MSLKKSELYFVIRSFKNHFINTLRASKYYSEKYKRLGKLKIFLIRFFYSFYFIRNLIGHNNKLQNILEKNIFIKDENSKEIIKEIIKKGYYKTSIKSEIIDLINNDFKKNNFKYEFKPSFDEKTGKYIIKEENIKFPQNINLNEILEYSNKQNLYHVLIKIFPKLENEISKISQSCFFLNIAKSYLNSEKIILIPHCIISNSFSVDVETKKKSAQYFHYDADYRKFFKVFIYLNDVDQDGGPHTFVQKTHKKKKFRHSHAERIHDEEIIKFYGEENIKTFVGKKGTIIFEDTFGFHKGQPPISKSRLMLVLEYGLPPGIGDEGIYEIE